MTDDKKGLLGFIATPEGQGLLATVFGGMAGARRGRPLNTIGMAGMSGLMGYGNALDRNAQTTKDTQAQAFQKMQMDRINKQSAKEDQVDALAKNFFRPGTPAVPGGIPSDIGPMPPIAATPPNFDAQGYGNALMGVDPAKGAAWMQAMQKDNDLINIAPGGTLFDPRTKQPIFSAPFAPKEQNPNQPFSLGPDGSLVPNVPYQNYQRSLKPAPTSSDAQRGQIIFDAQGNAFNVNPYTNTVKPVAMNGKQIQGAQYSPGLQGEISYSKASNQEVGQAKGESTVKLKELKASLPGLEQVAADLSVLGKKATYTMTGQGVDAVRRQLGMSAGEGSVARKEYISKVDNEVLPLLRSTFGAAFTAKEGDSLKATLGDPNASPEEKDAVLRSFIQTKRAQIKGLEGAPSPAATMRWNPQTRKLEQVK